MYSQSFRQAFVAHVYIASMHKRDAVFEPERSAKSLEVSALRFVSRSTTFVACFCQM